MKPMFVLSCRVPRWQSVVPALIAALAATAASVAFAAAPDAALFGRAFTYAFPLHEMALQRSVALGVLPSPSAPPQNAAPATSSAATSSAGTAPAARWQHTRALTGARDRWVTTPNNDTLYSSAWLDLSRGPVRIATPEMNGRYYSVALLDPFTNNFAMLGRRTVGTRPASFVVVGPAWTGALPENEQVVVAPSNDVLAFLRIVVDGPGDLERVHALQDAFRLEPVGDPGPDRPVWSTAIPADPAARFVTLVNEMLARNPVPAHERELVRSFSSVGLCGRDCAWDKLPEEVRAAWQQLWPQLNTRLRTTPAPPRAQVSGWLVSRTELGNFGTHYGYRASVALGGLLALEPVEAMYLVARSDGRGEPLTGERRYRLRVPAGGLPVDAFWSLSMYEVDATGRLFFVDNALERYAIGDRTPGLARNADGSIDLLIQADAPADATQRANWLPAPKGAFRLILWAYQPRAELLDLRATLPALERLP